MDPSSIHLETVNSSVFSMLSCDGLWNLYGFGRNHWCFKQLPILHIYYCRAQLRLQFCGLRARMISEVHQREHLQVRRLHFQDVYKILLPVLGHVTEDELLQDLIYCFQGVEGKFLRKETDGFGFVLDPKTSKGISLTHKSLVERLASVGFFHNQLKYFCDNTDKNEGTVAQALSAILREELSEHYRAVAILQSQVIT